MIHMHFSRPRAARHVATRRVAVLFVAAAVAAATGCGGADSSTGPNRNDPFGLYALQQVGYQRIPSEIYSGPYYDPASGVTIDPVSVKITGGELVLGDDASVHLAVDYSLSGQGRAVGGTLSWDGTYSMVDLGQVTEITLATDHGEVSAELQGRTVSVYLRLVDGGKSLPYAFTYVP